MDSFRKALRALFRADAVIAAIWLNIAVQRAILAALATLIAVFGLSMLNFAGYLALEPLIGDTRAALSIGIFDIFLAFILLVIATRTKPSRELKLAQELRENAIEQLISLANHPLDLASHALITPLIHSIIKGLRSKA
jgi:hypothetical protein